MRILIKDWINLKEEKKTYRSNINLDESAFELFVSRKPRSLYTKLFQPKPELSSWAKSLKTNITNKLDLTKFNLQFNIPKLLIIKKLSNSVHVHFKAHDTDAVFDLTIITRINKNYGPGTELYGIGLCIELPKGTYGQIVARSSLSKLGYLLANGAGIINEGYRGEINIILFKTKKSTTPIFDRLPITVAQLIIRPLVEVKIEIATVLSKIERKRF
jgi:dUTPase